MNISKIKNKKSLILSKTDQNNKIKLVQIIADSDLSGGPRHVLGILKNIDKEKFEVYLICPAGVLAEEAREIGGVTVETVPIRSKFDFASKSKVLDLIAKIQTRGNPFGPMIVHIHGPRAAFLTKNSIGKGIFRVYTEHIWCEEYFCENRLSHLLQKWELGRINSKNDLIIAVSKPVKDFLLKNNMAPKNRTIVIPNGIDAMTAAKTPFKIKTKHHHLAPVIGSVGSLISLKGYEYLIEAMDKIVKTYPHAMLEIIGEGEERKNLEEQIRRNVLERHVTLLGRKNNPFSLERQWNIYVSPSLSETFGIAVLEAMVSGLPVVATRVGGVAELIKDGKSGILIKPGSPAEIAKAVIEIVSRPAFAEKLARAGRERAEKFRWEKVIKLIEREYIDLVK